MNKKFIIPLVLVGALLVSGGAFAAWYFVIDNEEVVEVVQAEEAQNEVVEDEVEVVVEESDEDVVEEIAVAQKPKPKPTPKPVVKTLECSTVSCLIDGVKRNVPVNYHSVFEDEDEYGTFRLVDDWEYVPAGADGIYAFSNVFSDSELVFKENWYFDAINGIFSEEEMADWIESASEEELEVMDWIVNASDEELIEAQELAVAIAQALADLYKQPGIECRSADRGALLEVLDDWVLDEAVEYTMDDYLSLEVDLSADYMSEYTWQFCL